MLTVHHLQDSQSERIVWLCEELDIPYDLKVYKRAPVFSPEEYVALHPLGAAPVIDDGEIRMAESMACAEYIVNVHGSGRLMVKPGEKHYADYLYWYQFANGSLQPAVGKPMYLKFAGIAADNPTLQNYKNRLHKAFKFMNERLGSSSYLGGDEFTLADLMPVFSLTTMRQFTQDDISDYPNILSWLKRVTARPAYKRAMEKGDPHIKLDQMINGPAPPLFPPLAARAKV